MDAKLKALKARNEYILSMDSANAAIHKYFVEDLSDIVDVSLDYKVSPLLLYILAGRKGEHNLGKKREPLILEPQ